MWFITITGGSSMCERVPGGFYRELKRAGFDAFWQRAAKGLVLSGYNLVMAHNVGAFDETGKITDFRQLCLTPGSLS